MPHLINLLQKLLLRHIHVTVSAQNSLQQRQIHAQDVTKIQRGNALHLLRSKLHLLISQLLRQTPTLGQQQPMSIVLDCSETLAVGFGSPDVALAAEFGDARARLSQDFTGGNAGQPQLLHHAKR